ncbi:MAG: alpha-E domain-containing protein [bacterium]
MLSRVAENLFWVGRNVERSSNICRLLDATYQVQLGELARSDRKLETGPTLAPVLRILGIEPAERASLNRQLRRLTFGRAQDHTIATLLNQAKENTRASQNVIGGEPFSQLNRMTHAVGGRKTRARFRESPSMVLSQIERGCLLFFAMVDHGQPRSSPWHFMNLGRQIESIGMLARILYEGLVSPQVKKVQPGFAHWAWLLNSCAARDTYMSRYPEGFMPANLVEQLLLSPEFPHSIRFGVIQARTSLEAIALYAGSERSKVAERLIGRLDSHLKYTDSEEVMATGLDSLLGEIQWTCDQVSEQLYNSYF